VSKFVRDVDSVTEVFESFAIAEDFYEERPFRRGIFEGIMVGRRVVHKRRDTAERDGVTVFLAVVGCEESRERLGSSGGRFLGLG